MHSVTIIGFIVIFVAYFGESGNGVRTGKNSAIGMNGQHL